MPDEPTTPPPLRRPWSRSARPVPRRVVQPVQRFMHTEASGGVVLLVATVAALVWANVAAGAYEDLWTTELTVRLGDLSITEDLRHVVNDGLMAVFFLVIGLEVKRELVLGELSTRSAALLPAFAALGGVLLPAAIFVALTAGDGTAEGWGIPVATDVAFALAALAALGTRVPRPLVAFLLGVAVVDDIVAIAIVAVYYTDGVALGWLGGATAGIAAMYAARVLGVRHLGPYVVLGLWVWLAVFESGVHATIAGVAIALITPAQAFQPPAAVSAEAIRTAEATADHPDDPDADAPQWQRLASLSREAVSPLTRVENGLHPWSSFVVLPVFALANAGIALDADAISAAADSPVPLAVAVALVAGKAIGLTAGTAAAVGLGLSRLPPQVRWAHVVGVGALAGIGFTVSLFITDLAFADPALAGAAKLGVLAGSIAAAALGATILWRARP